LHNLLHDRMDASETNLFDRMQSATKRMSLLVDDLLTYSEISAIPLKMEEVNLANKLQVVLSDLEILIEEKKAVIDVDNLPTVKGYKRQLQQLFQNLLGNAIKYSKKDEPPQITIRSEMVSGADVQKFVPKVQADKIYHLIKVQDNGIGFEQEYAERIFSMFQRLHGKSEYEGTGIGLSIVRKVVDNHNGFIWANSQPGKGAIFNVLLPAD
jgi:signal transduction histidine kinase